MLFCYSDYLTGFSKRKQERKKKAQENIMAKMKEEKRSIKLQVLIFYEYYFVITSTAFFVNVVFYSTRTKTLLIKILV